MTSSPVLPVPDRCITRLWHAQSGTRERVRVRDLSLRAIQISCTPFHPLRRLSLALSSIWMSVAALFFQLYLQPPFMLFFFSKRPVMKPFLASSQKTFSPLNVCLRLTILNFMFLFPCLLFPYFPLLRPHEIGGILPPWASSVSGTGGALVCDCASALHVCLKAASQFGSILNNLQQFSRFIRRSVVHGSMSVPAHFPSGDPLFTPFHTQSNAGHGKRK